MPWCTCFFIFHYILNSVLLFFRKIINWEITLLLLKQKIFLKFLLESISSLPVFRILFSEYRILKLPYSLIFILMTFNSLECISLENLVIFLWKKGRFLFDSKDSVRRDIGLTKKSKLLGVVLVVKKDVCYKWTRPTVHISFYFQLFAFTPWILINYTMLFS